MNCSKSSLLKVQNEISTLKLVYSTTYGDDPTCRHFHAEVIVLFYCVLSLQTPLDLSSTSSRNALTGDNPAEISNRQTKYHKLYGRKCAYFINKLEILVDEFEKRRVHHMANTCSINSISSSHLNPSNCVRYKQS